MTITASQVKDLREKTGAGMMDAKNALVEADGNMDKAMELLRQKGIATADKKSGRVAAEGQVQSYIAADKKQGVLIEVNCETDFVGRGEAFLTLVNHLAQQVVSKNPKSVEDYRAQVDAEIKEAIASIKENITVRRFEHYTTAGTGVVHSYIHTGGKIGVLIEVDTDSDATAQNPAFQQLVKDLAMQVASSAPEFVSRADVPAEIIEEEKRVELGKADLASKPLEIREKIVVGRVDKLIGQKVLLEQPFIKDPSKVVQDLLKEAPGKVTVRRFSRYVLGEGIEKKESNFAEEVMAQARG